VYGNTTATITGQLGTVGSQVQAQRQATQLDMHHDALRGLHEELAGAITRAKMLADRLLGCEPESINKVDPPKMPNDPPVLTKLELAAQTSRDLAQQIHYQLNRLERI